MKFLVILGATIVVALASERSNRQRSNWIHQNIRSNNQIDPSTSSSESTEQSPNILETKVYNPVHCILDPEPTSHELSKFQQWAAKHSKQYLTDREHSCRVINVINKLRDIHAHNKRFNEGKETYKRALNDLSDLTSMELLTQILLQEIPEENLPRDTVHNLHDFPEARLAVDHREENLVGPVGHQGRCGCCWAWSGADVFEGQLRKCGISEESISPQNFLDCASKSSNGCNGGNPYDVFLYGRTGGFLSAAQYPYYGKQNQCAYNRSDIIGYVSAPFRHSHFEISQMEPFMRKIVSSVGPISTIMYANDNFEDYASGVFSSADCKNNPPNHVVTIVGYGTDPKFGDYWLLKNSWGTRWGENGYGRIARGKNMCQFETRIYYAQIMDQNKKVCSFS